MKYCPNCKNEKEDSEFHKCKGGSFGLSWVCKDCRKEHDKLHNRGIYFKDYSKRNRGRLNIMNDKRRKNCIEDWLQYFRGKYPNGFICEICGVSLILPINGENKQSEVVHFDHKNGTDGNKMGPNAWLRGHRYNKENTILWESFGYGVLCMSCNKIIPTECRNEWLNRITQYIKKEDISCRLNA